jgi:hypothetical protein
VRVKKVILQSPIHSSQERLKQQTFTLRSTRKNTYSLIWRVIFLMLKS